MKARSLLLGLLMTACHHAQAEPFSYQGRLSEGGSPAYGIYDLRFTIHNLPTGGSALTAAITNTATVVSNGLFTATLDFGPDIFTGEDRWLEIGVRTNGSSSGFTTLDPRQPITASPYATFSAAAGSVENGWIQDPRFLGTTGNTPLDLLVNGSRALRLEPTANSPNIIGGFKGNLAGSSVVGVTIAGGGSFAGTNKVMANFAALGGGYANVIEDDATASAIAGGGNNRIRTNAFQSTISGGYQNLIEVSAYQSTISGGAGNTILSGARYSTIPGGMSNSVGGSYSLAAGNRAGALHNGTFVWADSTVTNFSSTGINQFLIRANGGVGIGTNSPTAALEVAGAIKAAAFQGNGANVTGINGANLAPASVPTSALSDSVVNSAKIADGSIVAADVNSASFATTFWKTDGNAGTTTANFLGTSDNQPLEIKVNGTRAFRLEPGALSGTPNVIGGSSFNTANGAAGATIAGGGLGSSNPNRIAVNFGTIGGGYANAIAGAAYDATIGGGAGNSIAQNAEDSTIGGGLGNAIDSFGDSALIAGGNGNHIDSRGTNSTIAGGFGNRIQTNNFSSTIAGGYSNRIGTNSEAATIGGGEQNIAAGRYTVIAGGRQNTNAGILSTIAGGSYNSALGEGISIGGGLGNSGRTNYSTIAGGFLNQNKGQLGTIGGGERNFLGGDWATIGGGYENICYGLYGTVPGGSENSVYADYGFAAGRGAGVFHIGCFVWADSQPNVFESTGPNQFDIRAAGGVRLNTDTELFWGSGSQLRNDQGGAIELGNSLVASTPYIDFHYGTGSQQDFNVRIINDGNRQLSVFHSDSSVRLMRLFAGGMEVNGTFVSISDRNVKADFESVNAKSILEKVAALPITRWHYTNDVTTLHIGPMAQDFSAAFKVGADDKHIATVDADGVALAAIQGLNQKLQEELQRRDAANAELKARLEVLEKLLLNKE